MGRSTSGLLLPTADDARARRFTDACRPPRWWARLTGCGHGGPLGRGRRGRGDRPRLPTRSRIRTPGSPRRTGRGLRSVPGLTPIPASSGRRRQPNRSLQLPGGAVVDQLAVLQHDPRSKRSIAWGRACDTTVAPLARASSRARAGQPSGRRRDPRTARRPAAPRTDGTGATAIAGLLAQPRLNCDGRVIAGIETPAVPSSSSRKGSSPVPPCIRLMRLDVLPTGSDLV